jgi:MYXO-CTERM domain-containing protein
MVVSASLRRIFSFPFLVLAFVTVSLTAAPARAMVTEPDLRVAPVDVSAREITDSGGRELHLGALFTSRGETINFVTDGLTKPAVFSPLCSFSGEMVLRGGGCHNDFGWYNVVPGRTGPPPDNEIYVLIPGAGLPPWVPSVGVPTPNPAALMFTGNIIRMDPNYKGGLIGFAIKATAIDCTQTHFSEQELNVKCTNCTPAGTSWITAVIWKSKVADSYYIGFEDLPMSPTDFTGFPAQGYRNDGDFNDFVYFVSGIVCDGGGAPCDTGLKGICKDGLQECVTAGQLMCKPVLTAMPEKCDGLDNDCNGMVDDNAPCPTNLVCDRGVCVPPCSATEFPCPPGYACDNKVCIEKACVGKICPEGQICKAGTCTAPCDGVMCPKEQVCRVGRCVKPCDGVTCAADRACESGVCVPSCKCKTCAADKGCDMSGACLIKGCENKACAAGEVCEAGNCIDACTGATCPSTQECKVGECVDKPKPDGGMVVIMPDYDAGLPASGGAGGAGGGSGMGGGGGTDASGGAPGNAGQDAAPDAPETPHQKITPGNGCRCDASGATGAGGQALVMLALVALVSGRRRRSR